MPDTGSSSATTARGRVANAVSALGGEVVQALLGVLIFFGLFSQLSDTDWGDYVAVITTGLIIGTVANLGSQELLVRNVARRASLEVEWGQTLATQCAGGAVGLAIGMAVRPVFFENVAPLTAFILLATNIVLFWLVESTVRVGQATNDLSIGLRGRLVFAIGRLAAVATFAFSGAGDLDRYALLSAPPVLAATAGALWVATRGSGTPQTFRRPPAARLRRGLPFVGTAGAQDLLAGFDRPLLNANGLTVETGQYGIADRLVRIASIPTMALVRMTAADFFAKGEHDDRATFDLAVRYAQPAAIYGFAASLGMVAFTIILHDLVPERLQPPLPMLAALAPMAALHALQLFPANMLTGTDRQGLRMTLYAIAAGLNIVANLILIPREGWQGAAWATLGAEVFLAITLWVTAWRVSRGRPAPSKPAELTAGPPTVEHPEVLVGDGPTSAAGDQ